MLYTVFIYLVIVGFMHALRWRMLQGHQKEQMRLQKEYTKNLESKNLELREAVFQAQKDESKRTRLLLFILRYSLRFQRIQRFLPRLLPDLPPPCPCGQSR